MKKINVGSQKTKVLATLGPASATFETLLAMVKAGADVFRLNFSHGEHADHLEKIKIIDRINEEYNVNIGILADLQGPKIRIGEIANEPLQLEKNDILTFVNQPCKGTKEKIYISYAKFAQDVRVKERVMCDDGKLIFEVINTNNKDKVQMKVIHGGPLTSRKGINLPDTKVSLPSLTEKDRRDLDFILTQPTINWVALSFVRAPEDVIELKQKIEKAGHFALVMSKIEKPEAVSNIKEIINESDAIMIARGDLGIEVPLERLPAIQKKVIQRCIKKGKPVVVATQMMESMIKSPTPTRAEISDVANAVLDGADAVMLSAETSVGDHPIDTVKVMNRIIGEAEKHYELKDKRPKPIPGSPTFYSDTICIGASEMAEKIKAKAIIGITVNGHTAFKVSSYRPKSNIYIFSATKERLAALNLVWGVKTFFYDKFTTTDGTIYDLCEILKDQNLLKVNDVVINTASMPLHKRFKTNTLKITIVD